jgi:hypothetical protein
MLEDVPDVVAVEGLDDLELRPEGKRERGGSWRRRQRERGGVGGEREREGEKEEEDVELMNLVF